MKTALICLAFVMALLNAAMYFRRGLWSRLISVVFWLLLIHFALDRQPWHMPLLIGVLVVNVLLLSKEMRRRRTAAAEAESADDEREASPDADSPAFAPVAGGLEMRQLLKDPRLLRCKDGTTITAPAGEHVWAVEVNATLEEDDDVFWKPLHCSARSPQLGGGGVEFGRNLTLMLHIEDCAADGPRKLIPWSEASPALREVFERRCLISGCWTGDDSRIGFPLRLGGREYWIDAKYLTWKTDLALDADGRRLWVRVSHLPHEEWEGGAPAEAGAKYLGTADEPTPAFCFELPAERLLPDEEDEEN